MVSQKKRECGSCERTSDNRYFDCPARMSDGRLFTDYRPRCDIHAGCFPSLPVQKMPPVQLKSHDQRQLMIQHGDELLTKARTRANTVARCTSCDQLRTMLPESTIQACNTHTCTFTPAELSSVPSPFDGKGKGEEEEEEEEEGSASGPVRKSGLGRDFRLTGGDAAATSPSPYPLLRDPKSAKETEKKEKEKEKEKRRRANCCVPSENDPDFLANTTLSSLYEDSDEEKNIGRWTSPLGGLTPRSVGGDRTVHRKSTAKVMG